MPFTFLHSAQHLTLPRQPGGRWMNNSLRHETFWRHTSTDVYNTVRFCEKCPEWLLNWGMSVSYGCSYQLAFLNVLLTSSDPSKHSKPQTQSKWELVWNWYVLVVTNTPLLFEHYCTYVYTAEQLPGSIRGCPNQIKWTYDMYLIAVLSIK